LLDQAQAATGAKAPPARVFISYSRKDVAFARRLVAALEARGIQAQIDEHDLPALEDWKRELLGFIREADTVVFIVSPRSVESDECEWEVAQVAAFNKRLAPVVIERVADDKVPAEIARINYLYFDPPNDFETQADKLAVALLTDAEWLKEHTRLGELARRWEADEWPSAQLLRSDEIDRAAAWAERRPRNAPAIPEALRGYLAAGRKFEKESRDQLRRTVGRAFVKPAEDALKEGRHEHAIRLVAAGALLARDLDFDPEVDTQLWGPAAQAIFENRTHSVFRGSDLVSLSPDGRRIVTAATYNTALIWDAGTGEQIAVLEGHTDRLNSASFSSDGRRIVTASADNTARIWDAGTGRQIASLGGQIQRLNSVSFSPDGQRIVSALPDGTARVWNAESGVELLLLEDPTDAAIERVSFGPDGRRIVTAASHTARVWDAASGEQIAPPMLGHSWKGLFRERLVITSASFSPDGRWIITASSDKTARVWDAETGIDMALLEKRILSELEVGTEVAETDTEEANRRILKGHGGAVWCASFSPDGSRVVTASSDKTARVWDAERGNEVFSLEGHTDAVWCASFSPDGGRIVTASSDNTARVWDARSGREIAPLLGHEARVKTAIFCPDGRRIVTTSDDGTARVWHAWSGSELLNLNAHPGKVRSASYSPDGRQIITASSDNAARLWDAEGGTEVGLIRGSEQPNPFDTGMANASFSQGGGRIAIVYRNAARVWDAESRREIACIKAGARELHSMSLSPDGRRIAIASPGKEPTWPIRIQDLADPSLAPVFELWDVETVQRIELPFDRGVRSVCHVSFSPDGRQLLLACSNGATRVLDAESGGEIVLQDPTKAAVEFASFSPDGGRIVTASSTGTAQVWDADSGTKIVVLEGHSGALGSALFSSDGRQIVTASSDCTVRAWDATSGKQIACFHGHADGVLHAAFSPDDRRIVSASRDTTARVWDFSRSRPLLRERAVVLSAALAHGIGWCTDSERADLLMQDAAERFNGDLYAEARRQLLDPQKYPPEELARREQLLEQTIADVRTPLHENCYLSPTQFAEKFGLAQPAAAHPTGATEAQGPRTPTLPATKSSAHRASGSQAKPDPSAGSVATPAPQHRRGWVLWLTLTCAAAATAAAGVLALGTLWR